MAQKSLAGLRVLVIEDEYFLADDLKQVLKAEGAAGVVLSGTLDDALRRIRDDGFEMALVDINLHGEAAYAAADELVKRGVPFGFVTGYAKGTLPPRFSHVPHWAKPYDTRGFVRELRRLRDRCREAARD